MFDAFSLAAAPVVAAVLALSGVAKLRSPQPARDSFVSLRLPTWLSTSVVPRVFPWAELALAVALLVLPGWWGVASSATALALMLTYLLVVVRALGFDEKVDCGCFGELGLGEVDRRTAWRNALLVAFAAVALAASILDARAVVTRWWRAEASDWGWLLVVVAIVVLTGQVVGWRAAPAAGYLSSAPVEDDEGGEVLDYQRAPIPFVEILDSNGNAVHLRALAARQAQLLVFVSTTCVACTRVVEQMAEWRRLLGAVVAVRPVMGGRHGPHEVQGADEALASMLVDALYDPDNVVSRTFQLPGVPAAVLLGMDGLLAGGPALGEHFVIELGETAVEQVGAALQPVEEVTTPPAGDRGEIHVDSDYASR